MNISGVSDLTSSLASQATSMKASQVLQAIQVDVLKQAMNQQKAAGEEVLQLMQSSPVPKTVGGNVDISA